MTKKQHYMTYAERLKLEAYHNDAKFSVLKISQLMGFSRQTIYNELRLGAYMHNYGYFDRQQYSADKAQQIHDYNQTAKGRPLKLGNDHEYAAFLESKMLGVKSDGKADSRRRFSPAAALAAAKREGFRTSVCVGTLYSYIDKGVFLKLGNKDLLEKSKRKRKAEDTTPRTPHPKLPSITERPEKINRRAETGHQEMDLIVGRNGSKSVLLVFVDRSSREPMLFKLPDRKAATIRAVIDKLEGSMPDFKARFRSITTDNGSEFLEYDKLTQSVNGGKRFEVYYCHSYAAWEKGSCENLNRMIRRWFPKGTSFDEVTDEDVAMCQEWLRHYPRKSLGWRCAGEISAA